ncbi:MAG: RhuM family protein [Treponema sp.]|nr:RhuM family protein [Treponema sp.]
MTENKTGEIVIFKTADDKISVDVRFEGETVWLTMDDERLKEAGGGDYWRELLTRIRDIRSSEKVMYRQVLDLYATSADYNPKSAESVA